MKLMVFGGDLRYTYLVKYASARGVDAYGLGCKPEELLCEDRRAQVDMIPHSDAVLTPCPWKPGFSVSIGGQSHTAEELFSRMCPGSTMMTMGTGGMPPDFEKTYQIRVIDLLEDEPFVMRNAVLTAEGAVASAMEKTGYALCASKCLIIGYGRIGRALCRMLLGLGSDVIVCARRESVREQIRNDGAKAADMQSVSQLLAGVQFIFTTPPETVLPNGLLAAVRSDAVLMDLASPPYGFDLNEAKALGLNALREPGLPGRYCPITAAQVMLDAVVETMKTTQKEP